MATVTPAPDAPGPAFTIAGIRAGAVAPDNGPPSSSPRARIPRHVGVLARGIVGRRLDLAVLRTRIEGAEPGPRDRFGSSVALGPTSVLIGAPWEDGTATHVNGPVTDEPVSGTNYNSGAAFIVW